MSICVPLYNGRAYLRDALQSVFLQTFSNWELVICDDASTDDSAEVCRSFLDPRVRYLRFDENGGQAVNWNRCVEAAAGRYVVLLHQDDFLAPSFIGQAADVLEAHPEVALVHCTVQHVDRNGVPIRVQRLYNENRVDLGEALFRQLLLRGCVVNPAGVMVRKRAYATVGSFTTNIAWGIDWHMWIRIALRFDVAYLTETLAFCREHAQSGTAGVIAAARNGSDELWVLDDIFKKIVQERRDLFALRDVSVRQVAHRTWCWAEMMCEQGLMHAARAGIRRAIEIWPRMLLEKRVWGLWLATYLGYTWFCHVRRLKSSLCLPGRGLRA